MQSNRPFVLVLLALLAIAAVVGWQMFGAAEPPVAPGPGAPGEQQVASSDAARGGGVEPAEAMGEVGDPRVREAVVVDPSASDLPSIVGQVVDASGQPIADAEVACVPGSVFARDFRDFDLDSLDLGDANPFDPGEMVARMRRQVDDRVVVRTGSDGRFRVRVEGTSRTVGMRVLARGYVAFSRAVARPEQEDVDVGAVQLEAGALVAGRVLDAAGNPVVGAYVARTMPFEDNLPDGMDFTFPGMDAMRDLQLGEGVRTDEAGAFELAHLEAGEFSLRARHPGHPTASLDGLSVAPGRALTNVLLTMPRGAEIRGTVSGAPADATGLRVMAARKPAARAADPTGGFMGMIGDATEMLGDAGMAFGERECDIAADGSFVMRGLQAGSAYRLWIGQQGLGFAGAGVCSERVEAAADSVGVVLRYEPGVTVTFVVVDDASGAPIERLWVDDRLRGGGGLREMMAFVPSNAQQRDYPDGRVTVANLRPKDEQKLQLTIRSVGYQQLVRGDIELPASGELDLGALRMTPNPVLQVTVLAADGGRPVAGARVRLDAAATAADGRGAALAMMRRFGGGAGPDAARTDSAGQCTINVVDGEAGALDVTRRGYAPARVEVPPSSALAREQVVRLVVGGVAEVRVQDADQQPLAGVRVEHRTPFGESDRGETDADGLARFEHLAPGRHEFRVGKAGGGMFAAEIARATGRGGDDEPWAGLDVADREVAKLTLEKRPTARLTGVVRENGVPLAGARISFREGQAAAGAEDLAENMMESVMGRMGQGTQRRARTGDDGAYELTELPSGAHTLRVTHSDRAMPSTVTVTLRDGDNRIDVDLEMTTLRGVVRGPDGQPVDGARVSVARAATEADGEGQRLGRMVAGMMPGMGVGGSFQRTDANGAFELRGVDADVELEVRASAADMAPAATRATVGRGATSEPIALQLGAAGSIEVSVEGRAMFAAVTAEYVSAGDERVEPVMQMLRRGKGVLRGLRPGTWEVSYRGMNGGGDDAPKRTVEVVAGQAARVDF